MWDLEAGLPLSLSFTALSICDLGLFNLENNLSEASVSLLPVLRSPSRPHDSARTLSLVPGHPWSPLLKSLVEPPACHHILGH